MASKKVKAPVNIPTEKIHSFEGHPYKVLDNEEMVLLSESIKERGFLSPIIVRPIEEAEKEYEVISGHRRLHAAINAEEKNEVNNIEAWRSLVAHLLWALSPTAAGGGRREGDKGAAVKIARRSKPKSDFGNRKVAAKPRGPQVRILSPRPYKNESYDTFGIATFVLFFLSELPVTQGFGAMWQKRIVSLSYPPALISMLFRCVLTPCSDAEIHNETFLKRIISL